MAISYFDTKARSVSHSMDVTVDVSGMGIIVRAASITICGEDCALTDDWSTTLGAEATYDRNVCGYLVKKVSDGSIEVLIDEILLDGIDVAYPFGTEYELLANIFHVVVPAGTTNLSTLDMDIWRILPIESEQIDPPEPPSRGE